MGLGLPLCTPAMLWGRSWVLKGQLGLAKMVGRAWWGWWLMGASPP